MRLHRAGRGSHRREPNLGVGGGAKSHPAEQVLAQEGCHPSVITHRGECVCYGSKPAWPPRGTPEALGARVQTARLSLHACGESGAWTGETVSALCALCHPSFITFARPREHAARRRERRAQPIDTRNNFVADAILLREEEQETIPIHREAALEPRSKYGLCIGPSAPQWSASKISFPRRAYHSRNTFPEVGLSDKIPRRECQRACYLVQAPLIHDVDFVLLQELLHFLQETCSVTLWCHSVVSLSKWCPPQNSITLKMGLLSKW